MAFMGGPDEWDDTSRNVVAVIGADRAARCPGCGTKRSDWFDEHGNELHEPAFEVVEVQCPGCERREVAEETAREADADRKGVKFALAKAAGMHPGHGPDRG